MKWILIWVIVSASGGVSSGSAEFENIEACYSAQKSMGRVEVDATTEQKIYTSLETACVNSTTGERKTIITPRKR